MPESQGALTHVRYPRFYVYTRWFLQLPFRRGPFVLLCWPGLAFLGLTGLQQSEGMFQEGYTTGALHREQNDRGLLPCPEASAVEAGIPGSMDKLAGDLGCGCHPCALPLPHGSSTGSPEQSPVHPPGAYLPAAHQTHPEWSLCTHLEPQLWQLQPKEQLWIAWPRGQQGSHVWSHRTIYICIISKLLPDGLASRQPRPKSTQSSHGTPSTTWRY